MRAFGNEKQLERKYRAQKEIDDQRIAVVYEALSKGIELEGNDLYYGLLDRYPYFQKILSERKKAMEKMKRLAKMQQNLIKGSVGPVNEVTTKSGKKFTAKYKFEQRFVDKHFLSGKGN